MSATNATVTVAPVVEEKIVEKTSEAKIVEEKKVVEKKTAEVKVVEEKVAEKVVEEKAAEKVVEEVATVETNEEMVVRATELLSAGKIAYAKHGYEMASDKLSECCIIFQEVFGEKCAELYEPMMFYARTLLDLSRMEQSVIANALTGVEETADESTDEVDADSSKIEKEPVSEEAMDKVADQVADALEENAEAADNAAEEKSADAKTDVKTDAKTDDKPATDAKKDDKPTEVKTDAKPAEGEAKVVPTDEAKTSTGEPMVEETAEEGSGEENDAMSTNTDDISNIQLAYENCSTARLIAETQMETVKEEKEKSMWLVRLCEALLLLGEVQIGDESFEAAIVDLQKCETHQRSCLAESDRRIAETFFQMGRAFTNMSLFKEAADVYGKAMMVIKLLKTKTEEQAAAAKEGEERDGFTKEAVKLDTLLKDIDSWMKDSIDSHKSAEEAKKEQGAAEASTIGTTKDAADAANDITNLVRKRKVDEPEEAKKETTGGSPTKENSNEGADVAAKKAKVDETNKPTATDAAAAVNAQ